MSARRRLAAAPMVAMFAAKRAFRRILSFRECCCGGSGGRVVPSNTFSITVAVFGVRL